MFYFARRTAVRRRATKEKRRSRDGQPSPVGLCAAGHRRITRTTRGDSRRLQARR